MPNTLISIIIPAYNRSKLIGRTIDSFIAQSYKDWEMLVVDDHSTDNTREVVDAYCRKDTRIHYLLNERKKGAPGARNTGIIHASANWVLCFDSDDYAYPNFLEKMMPFTNDEYDVITCDANIVDINGNWLERRHWGGEGYIERELMQEKTYVNNNDSIIRKSKLYEIGLMDEDCKAYQELDTHIRLSRICRYKLIDEALYDWYTGGADAITTKEQMNRDARCYVIWHNRKRWRELEYESLLREMKKLYPRVSIRYKWLLIKAAPETVLYFIPGLYVNVIIRKINKYLNVNIPQLYRNL